jgi:hypothetical protein
MKIGPVTTKAHGNPWFEARKNAARYDEKLRSREGAAEALGISVSSVADAELGLTKVMPVEKAVRMADVYNAPYLLNYYCMNECPIGCHHSLSWDVQTIERVTLKLIKQMDTEVIDALKCRLVDIAEDGKISEDEKADFSGIIEYLDGLGRTISELKILGEISARGAADETKKAES